MRKVSVSMHDLLQMKSVEDVVKVFPRLKKADSLEFGISRKDKYSEPRPYVAMSPEDYFYILKRNKDEDFEKGVEEAVKEAKERLERDFEMIKDVDEMARKTALDVLYSPAFSEFDLSIMDREKVMEIIKDDVKDFFDKTSEYKDEYMRTIEEAADEVLREGWSLDEFLPRHRTEDGKVRIDILALRDLYKSEGGLFYRGYEKARDRINKKLDELRYRLSFLADEFERNLRETLRKHYKKSCIVIGKRVKRNKPVFKIEDYGVKKIKSNLYKLSNDVRIEEYDENKHHISKSVLREIESFLPEFNLVILDGNKVVGAIDAFESLNTIGLSGIYVWSKAKPGTGKKAVMSLFDFYSADAIEGMATIESKGFGKKLGAEFDDDEEEYVLDDETPFILYRNRLRV